MNMPEPINELVSQVGVINVAALQASARQNLEKGDYLTALQEVITVLTQDGHDPIAYRIGEKAAIALGEYELAQQFFLSKPNTKHPLKPHMPGHNPALHPRFVMPTPLIGPGNDYRHILERASLFVASGKPYTKTVSVIIPVYNRRQLLANTLAALTHQTYPQELIEIVVVDDGSEDDVLEVIHKYQNKLNIRYAWQPDQGYQLAAARNLGIRCSKGEALVFMDADVLPLPNVIESYMRVLHVADDAVLLGHVRFVDVTGIPDYAILEDIRAATQLPDIIPDNDTLDENHTNEDGLKVDWRGKHYQNSNHLLNSQWPFHFVTGWSFALSRTLSEQAGGFDEDFQAWGFEETEFAYRTYNAGAYFVAMLDVECLHQEPLEPITKTEGASYRKTGQQVTQQLFASKCPVPNVRQHLGDSPTETPKVSIFIRAHNVEAYIVAAVQSCLDQNFSDLEVCICDDGSTDNTVALLEKHFKRNPKVRWVSQPQGGVGKAGNTALALCRGMYIGQLDGDDLLKPEAVSACVAILDKYSVDGVYTDYEYIDDQGNYCRDGWCPGVYDRSQLLTLNICTHFRMLRRRVLSRAGQFDENLMGAEDLDYDTPQILDHPLR